MVTPIKNPTNAETGKASTPDLQMLAENSFHGALLGWRHKNPNANTNRPHNSTSPSVFFNTPNTNAPRRRTGAAANDPGDHPSSIPARWLTENPWTTAALEEGVQFWKQVGFMFKVKAIGAAKGK
ncbi:hypothetical protein FACS1894185_5180 [Betaproteobacteria bacterium]|nr:hypothetical protein FACS1894185_5180 [Betaproteobacteria bacterium]